LVHFYNSDPLIQKPGSAPALMLELRVWSGSGLFYNSYVRVIIGTCTPVDFCHRYDCDIHDLYQTMFDKLKKLTLLLL